jgi:HTH DNA binding domain
MAASGKTRMRRVVIELPEREIEKLGSYTAELSRDVESFEVVHHVRHGTEGSAILCKVKPKEGGAKLSDLKFRFKKFEILSEEKDGFLVYLEAETAPLSPEGPDVPKVYLNFPFEVRGGNRRVTLVGATAELKKFFHWLQENGVRFEVISNSDSGSSPNSILNSLSEQQRKALLSAYTSGYYKVPRKVNLDVLARRQNINKSTFAEHLAKAENHLISRVLADELGYLRPDGNTV